MLKNKILISFKDEKQKWTQSEVERFAYLHFKKGIYYNVLKSHFDMYANHFYAIVDYIHEHEEVQKWRKE